MTFELETEQEDDGHRSAEVASCQASSCMATRRRPRSRESRRTATRRTIVTRSPVLALVSLASTLARLPAGAPPPAHAQAREPIKIGLAAAVSGGSAASGEAIKRGITIA